MANAHSQWTIPHSEIGNWQSKIPYDLAAEEAVIASCMLPGAHERVAEMAVILDPRDFFREHNGWAFAAILALWELGSEINQITVAHELARRGQLEPFGGQARLADYIRALPTPIGAAWYARIVATQRTYRELISAASAIAALAREADDDVEGTLARAAELIHAIGRRTGRASTQTGQEVLDSGLSAWLEAHLADPRALAGIPTGFEKLDWLLDGFQPGAVYTIAAETSVGKSTFVQDLTRTLAYDNRRVLFVSTEMRNVAVGKRLLFLISGIGQQAGRNRGWYDDDEKDLLNDAAAIYSGLPVTWYNPWEAGLAGIRAEARRLAGSGIDVIVLDHVDHLIESNGTNRANAVSEGMRDIKKLAVELGVAILVISHLSRSNMNGKVARLKDGSAKEQDSDVVLFLQPVRRLGNDTWEELSLEEAQQVRASGAPLDIRLEVYKNRDGMTGNVQLRMDWAQGGRFLPSPN